MSTDQESGWSHIGQGIGTGIVLLCFCLGIGGCWYLCAKGDAELARAKQETQK